MVATIRWDIHGRTFLVGGLQKATPYVVRMQDANNPSGHLRVSAILLGRQTEVLARTGISAYHSLP